LFKSAKGLVGHVTEGPSNLTVVTTSEKFNVVGNTITLKIGTYTLGIPKIDTKGAANFNLEYVPFNLMDAGKWKAADSKGKSKFNLDGTNLPVWIIRNGMNDAAQTATTDFGPWKAGINWNGAVSFAVKADEDGPYNPPDDPDTPPGPNDPWYLVIWDGQFEGFDQDEENALIQFKTAHYSGEATAYYAIVAKGDTPPAFSAYSRLEDEYSQGTHENVPIPLPDFSATSYDIYVRLLKGDKISKPVKINTTEGGLGVDSEWGRPIVMALTTNRAIWSDDNGETWNEGGTHPYIDWKSVTYGDGVFVGVSWGKAIRSEDYGETWTDVTLSGDLKSVAYGNGKFVAVSNGAGETTSYASYDYGKTWIAGTMLPDYSWTSVAYGNGKFVAVTGPNDNKAARSDDGINWEVVEMGGSPNGGYDWGSVAYGNDKFIAVVGNTIKSSTDGEYWTERSPLPNVNGRSHLAYGDGKFVVVSSTNTAYFSTDGISWESTGLPGTGWRDVAYGADGFMAINDTGQVAWFDGTNWTVRTLSPGYAPFCIAFNN
jgi:hypothetical protein